jgi:ribosomal-protein-alanine N-acetyltransferase
MEPFELVRLILRPMTVEDIDRVYTIDVASFSLPWSERSYRFELTQNENSHPWVAEAHNAAGERQVVGLVVTWLILDEAHIATLAIDPAWRRKGIARRLIANALAEAAKAGAAKAFLEVRRGNQPALQLYQDFGFQVVGVRPKYYKDNMEDALLMTLEPIIVI